MKITTGAENYEILESGTLLTFKNEPITFNLTEELRITLSFENDKNINDHQLSFRTNGNKELEIRLTNFNNSLGTGNASPLPLAKIDGRQAYLNFYVKSIGDEAKEIIYTWYLREEVENG